MTAPHQRPYLPHEVLKAELDRPESSSLCTEPLLDYLAGTGARHPPCEQDGARCFGNAGHR